MKASPHPLCKLWQAAGFNSAEELAKACDMQPESIRKINWGWRGASGETLTKLCQALKVPPETVMAAIRNAKRRVDRRQVRA